jgi:hypothetical protein
VISVRKRTIPTERPALLGEVSANFYGGKNVAAFARSQVWKKKKLSKFSFPMI